MTLILVYNLRQIIQSLLECALKVRAVFESIIVTKCTHVSIEFMKIILHMARGIVKFSHIFYT